MLAASSVLAASYLRFSYTPPPGTSQRAGVSARFSERSEVGCVFNSLQRWVRDKSPRVSGERWPHVVAYCSDSLSLVCWLVEHSCAAPLPSTQAHTHILRYTSTQAYTNPHTHITHSNVGGQTSESNSISIFATVGQTGRAGDTGVRVGQHQPPAPSNQRDGGGGKCRAEKNKSHWGLAGCGGRLRVAKVSRADS